MFVDLEKTFDFMPHKVQWQLLGPFMSLLLPKCVLMENLVKSLASELKFIKDLYCDNYCISIIHFYTIIILL